MKFSILMAINLHAKKPCLTIDRLVFHYTCLSKATLPASRMLGVALVPPPQMPKGEMKVMMADKVPGRSQTLAHLTSSPCALSSWPHPLLLHVTKSFSHIFMVICMQVLLMRK